jgi:transposase
MELRRHRAARLFAAGKSILAAIARELKVTRQSVSRWYEAWKRHRTDWVRGARRAGRKPKLSGPQFRQLDRCLRQGARAHGFGTDLWTLPRVAALIERLTGVKYHPGHVWKLLQAMDWSLQRPAKQAKERNGQARREWMGQRWPAVKKRPAREGLDHLPGRKRSLRAAAREKDLGAEGRNACPDPRLQLEEIVTLRGPGLSLGRPSQPPLVPVPAGQL